MITFNLFMETDDPVHGTFYSFCEEVIGSDRMNTIIKSVHPEQQIQRLWQEVQNTRKDGIRAICSSNGKILINHFYEGMVIGYLEKDEDSTKCIKKVEEATDDYKNIFHVMRMQHRASLLLSSDLSAYNISKETGVAESTIKDYRKDKYITLDGMSILNLKKLLSYPGIDDIISKKE